MLAHGVDPSFALGMFWRESSFGTAGWNLWADLKSWGNVLWVNCQVRDVPGVEEYKAANGFEYAKYPDWGTGAEDFCRLLDDYTRRGTDARYGDISLVYGATAKWAANPPGSDDHIAYVDNVVSRMNRYDTEPPQEGEMAISAAGVKMTTDASYWLAKGEPYYFVPGKAANGKFSFGTRPGAYVPYFGRIAGTDWAAVYATTSKLTGSMDPTIVYVRYDPTRVRLAA